MLDHYERRIGCDELFRTVVHVLVEYQTFNAEHGVVLPGLDALLDDYRTRYPELVVCRPAGP